MIVLVHAPAEAMYHFADVVNFKLLADGEVLKTLLLGGNEKYSISPIAINHVPDICPIPPYEYIYLKYSKYVPHELYYKPSLRGES